MLIFIAQLTLVCSLHSVWHLYVRVALIAAGLDVLWLMKFMKWGSCFWDTDY